MSIKDKVFLGWANPYKPSSKNKEHAQKVKQAFGSGVKMWPNVLDKHWVNWEKGKLPDLSKFEFAFVNVLGYNKQYHIEEIRSKYPGMIIVAMPDPSIDLMLVRKDWDKIYKQLKLANVIACRTEIEMDFWTSLLNKKAYFFPSPIMPKEYFQSLITGKKRIKDRVLMIGHTIEPFANPAPIAAMAELSRRTGVGFDFYNADERDKYFINEIAKIPNVKFYDKVNSQKDFAEVIAQYDVSFDPYPRFSIHRHLHLCNAVGTNCVSLPNGGFLDSGKISKIGESLLDTKMNKQYRMEISNEVFGKFGYEASLSRLEFICERTKRRYNYYSLPYGYVFRERGALQKRKGASSFQQNVYRRAMNEAKKFGANLIVDYGCGTSYNMASFFKDFELVVGIDLLENVQESIKVHGHNRNFSWLSVINPSTVTNLDRIDFLVCADVIEHIPLDELDTLKNIIMRAKRGIISTPDSNLINNKMGPPANIYHTQEWNLASITEFVESLEGVRVIDSYHEYSRPTDDKKTTAVVVFSTVG